MVNGPVSFSGLVSGLNTQSIISAEMAVYEQPLTNLQTEQTTINNKIADYQTINTQLLSLQQAADALAYPAAFQRGLRRSILELLRSHREREPRAHCRPAR